MPTAKERMEGEMNRRQFSSLVVGPFVPKSAAVPEKIPPSAAAETLVMPVTSALTADMQFITDYFYMGQIHLWRALAPALCAGFARKDDDKARSDATLVDQQALLDKFRLNIRKILLDPAAEVVQSGRRVAHRLEECGVSMDELMRQRLAIDRIDRQMDNYTHAARRKEMAQQEYEKRMEVCYDERKVVYQRVQQDMDKAGWRDIEPGHVLRNLTRGFPERQEQQIDCLKTPNLLKTARIEAQDTVKRIIDFLRHPSFSPVSLESLQDKLNAIVEEEYAAAVEHMTPRPTCGQKWIDHERAWEQAHSPQAAQR